jgi:hypothetical protein
VKEHKGLAIVSMTRPAVFVSWQLLKLGFYLSSLGGKVLILLGNYI